MVKCKVNRAWLDREDSNGCKISDWGSIIDPTSVQCNVCHNNVSVAAKGFQALTQHSMSQKHITAFQVKRCPQQLVLAKGPPSWTSTSQASSASAATAGRSDSATASVSAAVQSPSATSVLQLASRTDGARRSELLWAMKCIQSNFSAASCEDIVDLFKEMFGEEHVPSNMSLGRTKVAYLWTDALGPYFHNLMLEDARAAVSFSIGFDETTNEKRVKELQIGIRYYSESRRETVCHHLETIFIGTATSEIVSNLLFSAVERAMLSLPRWLMLSSDGPNVNKAVFRILSDRLKLERGTSLMNIGFCNLHVLHNSFSAGLNIFGSRVAEIVILVYDFLDYPSRFEVYEKSQSEKKVPKNNLSKHVKTRWLTLGPSASRLLEQWPAICHYFLKVLPNKKEMAKVCESKCYQSIADACKDQTFPAEIAFVIHSAAVFERFSKLFQLEQPMIHMLYDEVESLYFLLLSRFCKSEVIQSKSKSQCKKEAFINDKSNWMENENVEIGQDSGNLLEKARCSVQDPLKLRASARQHYIAAATYMLSNSILSKGSEALHFKCLQPQQIKEERSVRSIVIIKNLLRINLEVEDDTLRDEWRLLAMVTLPPHEPQGRIDHFWRLIFEMKDATGGPKFPSVSKVVKSALCMSHGNSDIERGFSLSRNQLPCGSAAMEERTLNARLNIKDGLKAYDGKAANVPISKPLITAAQNAYGKYEEHMSAKRKEQEEELKRKEREDAERQRKEEEEKRQKEERRDIQALTKDLNVAKAAEDGERRAADNLVDEANEKLKKALQKGDIAAAKVAQGMLEGAQAMRARADNLKKKKSEPLQKRVEKRTFNLLEKLFQNSKRPRGEDPDVDPDVPH